MYGFVGRMYSVRCREDYSIFEKVWNEMEDENVFFNVCNPLIT